MPGFLKYMYTVKTCMYFFFCYYCSRTWLFLSGWQVGDTPLHLAAKHGQHETLQLLLDNFDIRNEVNQVIICPFRHYQHLFQNHTGIMRVRHTLIWFILLCVCRRGRPLCIWLQMELMRTVYKPCWRHNVTQTSLP